MMTRTDRRYTSIFFSTSALSALILALILAASGSAHAIPLPDNSSCSSGGYCFEINNTAGANAIYGKVTGSANGIGVTGYSANGYGGYFIANTNYPGVLATSATGLGVNGIAYGTATTSHGVDGQCPSSTGGCVGVLGKVNGASTGTAVFGDAANSASAWAGYFVGDISARTYYNNSDARLKKNIKGLSSGVESIIKLRPVTYEWKSGGEGGKEEIGLIAQEVQKVFPNAVRADSASGMLGVNYTAMVPILIKSVQEQQATIQRLESRITALERARAPMLQSSAVAPAMLLGGFGLLPLALVQTIRRRRAGRPAA